MSYFLLLLPTNAPNAVIKLPPINMLSAFITLPVCGNFSSSKPSKFPPPFIISSKLLPPFPLSESFPALFESFDASKSFTNV